MVACPITSRPKGYPFEVSIPHGCGVEGVILADHIRSMDWKSRGASPAGRVPEETLLDTLSKLKALLDIH